jgi:hypothetical protein
MGMYPAESEATDTIIHHFYTVIHEIDTPAIAGKNSPFAATLLKNLSPFKRNGAI